MERLERAKKEIEKRRPGTVAHSAPDQVLFLDLISGEAISQTSTHF